MLCHGNFHSPTLSTPLNVVAAYSSLEERVRNPSVVIATYHPLMEHVVLLDRLGYVPHAAHAGGKRREVTLRDRYRLPSVARRDSDLPLQQITRFGGTVRPRELRRRTPPRAPVVDAGKHSRWMKTEVFRGGGYCENKYIREEMRASKHVS